MKVSIITATYNSEKTIKDTIVSVNKQSYKNIEHILIDGASNDNTLQLSQFYGHNGPTVSEKDSGIYDAMNKGISKATGDVIGILNSDDFYTNNDVIEKVVKAFEDENVDAVYGDLLFVDAHNVKKVNRKWIAGGYDKKLFYRGWMPPHPTVFVRKRVYVQFGAFDTRLKNSSDYELILRLMFQKNIKVKYLPGVMVHMRQGGHSNSSLSNRLAAHKEDYLAWKMNGIAPKWYTLTMKPLRKVKQFALAQKSLFLCKILSSRFLAAKSWKKDPPYYNKPETFAKNNKANYNQSAA